MVFLFVCLLLFYIYTGLKYLSTDLETVRKTQKATPSNGSATGWGIQARIEVSSDFGGFIKKGVTAEGSIIRSMMLQCTVQKDEMALNVPALGRTRLRVAIRGTQVNEPCPD